MNSLKIEVLEVQGCSSIRVRETKRLRSLSIANNAGRPVVLGCNMLQWASEVKHLYMKVEFTVDFEALQPFPEIDFVDFFNNHPKLQKFDVHGAMFAALCQKNSLKSIDRGFFNPLFGGGGHHSQITIEC
ncbi:hypothetical protein TorRG33x02_108300 [Trema orientale]|uniref:Uncharacterized protein n=1 Tax=Trema orientale TaxID=63057 RepID=A0A2P5F664_TREOI|nr:hypothetical protein TorRG33x02_108300 [Trema orientale]